MPPETTKVVPLTCHGHSRPVTHLSFSAVTQDDQYYLISACKDNNPMLRDGITGDWIGTFIGHKGAVWQARLSADANLAATGSADFSAKIWDTNTGEALHTLQHAHIVRAVAFPPGPSPTSVATGGAEKKLRIFDLSRPTSTSPNTTPQHTELGPSTHTGTIKSIVWTPSPTLLVTAADDAKIRWWDLRTPSRTPIATHAVDGPIGSCELNTTTTTTTTATSSTTDNPSSILSVTAGKSVYFFDGTATRPGTLLKSVTLQHDVASVALNIPARRFVTGGGGDTWVRVYDFDMAGGGVGGTNGSAGVGGGQAGQGTNGLGGAGSGVGGDGGELEIGKGHHGPVWSVAFSPDGRLYATGSEDGTVKLWKFTGGQYGLWR